MRVALVHNVLRGGGHRRMREQVLRLDADVVEFCLEGAYAVTERPRRTRWKPVAERLPRALRPVPRYADHLRLRRAWRSLAADVDRFAPDVVLANSCHITQAPGALLSITRPSVYFCDEPRRVDYEPVSYTHLTLPTTERV